MACNAPPYGMWRIKMLRSVHLSHVPGTKWCTSGLCHSVLRHLVGRQEGHPACKKTWVVTFWRSYLSEVGCKWFACGAADATGTPSSPLHSTLLTRRAIKPQRQGHIGGPIVQPWVCVCVCVYVCVMCRVKIALYCIQYCAQLQIYQLCFSSAKPSGCPAGRPAPLQARPCPLGAHVRAW